MKRKPVPETEAHLAALSDVQLEIMHVLWDRGRGTVGEVWTELSTRRSVARNTVLTHIDRLVKKGWLTRQDDGPVQQFVPTQPRRQTLSGLARQFVDNVFSGSAAQFMLALLDDQRLSPDEVERIRLLLNEARRKQP